MAIAVVVDNPEGSQEIYEKVRAQIGLESAARTAAGASWRSSNPKRTQSDSVRSA